MTDQLPEDVEHRWEVEYVPDPMSFGAVVRSGDLRCADCGLTIRDGGTSHD